MNLHMAGEDAHNDSGCGSAGAERMRMHFWCLPRAGQSLESFSVVAGGVVVSYL